jgi:hypothetical protein
MRITPIVVQASRSFCANHLRARTQAAEASRSRKHSLSGGSECTRPRRSQRTSVALGRRRRGRSPRAKRLHQVRQVESPCRALRRPMQLDLAECSFEKKGRPRASSAPRGNSG